jgi:hypothetical protein
MLSNLPNLYKKFDVQNKPRVLPDLCFIDRFVLDWRICIILDMHSRFIDSLPLEKSSMVKPILQLQ